MKCPVCGERDDIYEACDDNDRAIEDSLGNTWFECGECGEQGIESDFEETDDD